MRAFGTTMGIASLLLSLTACGAVGVQSDSESVTLGTATTAGTPSAAVSTSTSTTASGILDRAGSQQQRDCLHCAP